MTTERCNYSDLHPDECDHCGAHPGSTITLEPPNPIHVLHQIEALARRSLPILGAQEYGHPLDIHDMIDELTRPHGHRERYTADRAGETWTGQHLTEVPSLVHQLLGAAPSGSGDQAGSTPHSRPAARLESVDTLMLIDDEAARWIRRLGEDDPGDKLDPKTKKRIPGSGTIACLQLLHGLHASQKTCGRPKPHRDSAGGRPNCCTSHTIEHDVRRWWHQARVITGWDSGAYRPFNTCPICEQRKTLRINLAMQAGFCVECRSVWTADEIGLLAEHIRGENGEDDAPHDVTA